MAVNGLLVFIIRNLKHQTFETGSPVVNTLSRYKGLYRDQYMVFLYYAQVLKLHCMGLVFFIVFI